MPTTKQPDPSASLSHTPMRKVNTRRIRKRSAATIAAARMLRQQRECASDLASHRAWMTR